MSLIKFGNNWEDGDGDLLGSVLKPPLESPKFFNQESGSASGHSSRASSPAPTITDVRGHSGSTSRSRSESVASSKSSLHEFGDVLPKDLDLPDLDSLTLPYPVEDNQIYVSNTETAIQEALSAQKDTFLKQLAEKDRQIKELLDAKVKEEICIIHLEENTKLVLEEYKNTKRSYLEQIEKLKPKLAVAENERQNVQKERDQALEDLKHVEETFSILLLKYKRVKGTLENLQKIEKMLKERDQDLTLKLENLDKKIAYLKLESTNNIVLMCHDFEIKYSVLQSSNLKMRTLLRKNEMAVETMGQNFEQKQKENVELNKLCEELIGSGLNVK